MTTPLTAREGILLNFEESFLGIKLSGGYLSDVRTVELEWKTYDEVIGQNLPMPYICFFPTKGKPPPEYQPFGIRREFLDVTVVGHVQGEKQKDKIRAVSALEQDIHDAAVGIGDGTRGDPTRGGYAVDTIKITGEETDEGVPDIGDQLGGSSTMVMTFRAIYFPGDC